MRGLDTNVLVRYLVSDDAKQAAAATRIIEQSRTSGDLLFIPVVVLCELAWVLTRIYGKSPTELVSILDLILRTAQFHVERDSVVRRSLEAFRAGRADFADYLIGEICREAGCDDCVTFDRALAGTSGFTVPR